MNVGNLIATLINKVLNSDRTVKIVMHDLRRMLARVKHSKKDIKPKERLLHLGAGKRVIPGWLNVDVKGSQYDLDFASGVLPWSDDVFDSVVSQHVIEHLDMESELIPLFRELKRCVRDRGEIWLSCPDMEKICHGYVEDKGESLYKDKMYRYSMDESIGSQPPVQNIINYIFNQNKKIKQV